MTEEKRDLAVLANEYGLSTTKARLLVDNFADVFKLADEWERKARDIAVKDEGDTHMMAAARELRLEIKNRRVEVEKKRKELKEDALREGKAIDGIANVIKGVIVPIEKYLDEQEHYVDIKRQAEEEERRRKAEELLRQQEAEEAERQRIAAEEQRKENERLKAEAEERERKAAEERAAHEAAMEKERQEREAERVAAAAEAEAKAKAAAAKARREAECKAEAERKERENQIAKERAEAEAKAKAEREEAGRLHQEELRKAAMVTCPKCGETFDSRGRKAKE